MPKALQVDWSLIKEVYSKGMSVNDIAKQFGVQAGTVAARASRGKWRELSTRAISTMSSAKTVIEVNQPSPESNALSKASALVREKLSQELLRAVDTLASTKPSKRLESLQERATLMQTLTGACKPVFGWSEGQSQPSVRINVMANAVSITEEQAKVIDIPDSESSTSDSKPQ